MTTNIVINFEKEIYEKYYQLVHSICLRRLHQKDSIDDAVQSVFLLYIRDQEKVKSSLSSWFYWASVNVCKVINSDGKKHTSKSLDDDEVDLIELEKRDDVCLDRMIESLPKKKREILLMRFFDDMSYKEIGEKVRCKESNVQKIIERTIAMLQSKVKKRDVLISVLLAQLFRCGEVSAATLNSNSFILQNTLIQQSIIQGVQKMYLYTKLKFMASVCICFTLAIPLSNHIFAGGDEIKVEKPKAVALDMIGKSLKYLASKQNADGSWSDKKYQRNAGVTALCCLAFLGEGSKPRVGKYGKNLEKGLNYLINNVRSSGVIAGKENSPLGPVYEHIYSTMALVLAYQDMPWDKNIRAYLGKALQVLQRTQREDGGWRYQFSKEGSSDMSVTSNVLFLFKLAEKAGFAFSKKTMSKGKKYVINCSEKEGFRYRPFSLQGSRNMDAMGIVALGWGNKKSTLLNNNDQDIDWGGVQNNGNLNDPFVKAAIDRIELDYQVSKKDELKTRPYFMYGCFYASIGLYSVGGQTWDVWYAKTKEILTLAQKENGSFLDQSDDTVYTTAMAAIILQAPKGNLPIYER